MEIHGKSGIVDFGGVQRDVQLDLLKDVKKGDYVLVHVGYAIQVVDPGEAKIMLDAWKEVGLGE